MTDSAAPARFATLDKVEAIVAVLLPWYAKNARDLPWRREPFCHQAYCVYVSEIMLQQTQVKTVIPYWERWMRELPTIAAAARATPEKLHKLWEGLGYYTRVRNLQKAAQQIEAQHGGRFPENFDAILALSGIGRYTAGAIASIAFNQAQPILDGNVIRVLTRIFGIESDPREKATNARLWELAAELVQEAQQHEGKDRPRPGFAPQGEIPNCSYLNQSLMELGALICTPRAPRCDVCPANNWCIARQKNLQEQIPNLGKRVAVTARRFTAFVVERDGKFLVQQRPEGMVNAHLWEFPNVEVTTSSRSEPDVSGFRLRSTQPFRTIKHSITRYRITLEAYHAELDDSGALISESHPGNAAQWLTLRQLSQRAFTSAHKKILADLQIAPKSGGKKTGAD